MKSEPKKMECLYGVILNDIDTSNGYPIEIGDWIVRKPDMEDLDLIGNHFRTYISSFHKTPFQEMEFTGNDKQISFSGHKKKSDFRYLIVENKNGSFTEMDCLSQAFRLSEADLWLESFACEFIGTKTIMCQHMQVAGFFDVRRPLQKPPIVLWENVAQVIDLRKAFEDEKYPKICDAIKMFRDNDSISEASHLKHLGYFAIIESLLSHPPAKNDSIDTITRQLKRNLKLLSNRMESDKNLMLDGFNGASKDKVISKLYSYRSSIAHGSSGEHELKELYQMREDSFYGDVWNTPEHRWISWFLRKVTQRLLVHSLKEPQLITDLK